MQMGVKAFRKIPEGLCGHNGPGFGLGLGHGGLDERLQGLPSDP